MNRETDVLIVGAGVAGLAAAAELTRAGISVLLIEARARLGGRILTLQEDEGRLAVELGAEFIHGLPPSLINLARAAGLPIEAHEGREYEYHDGSLKAITEDGEGRSKLFSKLDENGSDMSFAEWAAARGLPRDQYEQLVSYVEGFNAADAHVISIRALARQQHAEDAIDGDRISRFAKGYGQLVDVLAARIGPSGAIQLNSTIRIVQWKRGRIQAQALNLQAESFTVKARAAVVTVPVSLLQSGAPSAIRFAPEPKILTDLSSAIRMGEVIRITYRFREPVWERVAPEMGFLFSDEPAFPTWWVRRTAPPAPLITGWCGGTKAERLTGSSPEQLPDIALRALSKVLSLPADELSSKLVATYFQDWNADPLSLGAYSYIAAGGLPVADELTRPVEDTLFFAGEATASDGHWGTVHGAIGSGRRAAQGILQAFKS
jgi:monoamine oxidase